MTGWLRGRHQGGVEPSHAQTAAARTAQSGQKSIATAPTERPTFEAVYAAHFDLVRRGLHRLGVPMAALDDATHDVFLVVHRRLHEFDGRSSIRTWLYAIALRVAFFQRRRSARHAHAELPETLSAPEETNPHQVAAQTESVQMLYRLLEQLNEDQRAILVLVELEELSVPEAAQAVGIPVNTAYSRLRLARQAFELLVSRARARDGWRSKWKS